MTLRSPSRGEYWKRMTLVILLGLAVYAVVISEKGGGATFKIWRPERMRFAAIVLIVIGVAAYEFRRDDGAQKENPEEAVSDTSEESEGRSESRVPVVADSPAVAKPVVVVAAPAFAKSAGEKPRQGPDRGESPTLPVVIVSPDGDPDRAEELWSRAREITHGFLPDEVEDHEYLELIRKAAALGHRLAMVKLGDYAFRRGWIVEAYYWTLLAQLNGAEGLDVALAEIRKTWAMENSPPEYENVRPDFTETQGVFARAILRLKSGLDSAWARKRLEELSNAGCPEARLYLSRSSDRSVVAASAR